MDESSLIAALGGVGDARALLEGLFLHAPVPFLVYSGDGRTLVVNPAFRTLFGVEPPPGYNVLEDEYVERLGIGGLVRRAFSGETVQLPTQWYDPQQLARDGAIAGRPIALQATFFPLFDGGGAVSHVGVAVRDVTSEEDLKSAYAEQRRKDDGLILALEAGRMVTVDTDSETGRVYASENAREILGLPPDVPLETADDWLALLHPDDRSATRSQLAASAEGTPKLDRLFRLILASHRRGEVGRTPGSGGARRRRRRALGPRRHHGRDGARAARGGAEVHRGSAPAGAEDGGDRPPRGRRRARLQQPAVGDPQLQRRCCCRPTWSPSDPLPRICARSTTPAERAADLTRSSSRSAGSRCSSRACST